MEVNPGFKQTEAGVIPEDWQTDTLAALTVLMTNGFVGTATRHYASNDNGVLYIQGYNVAENHFNFHGVKYVTEDFHRANMKSCLRGGDLLTVQPGDVGLTTIVPESLAGSNCHALIISRFDKRRVAPKLISFYLNSRPGRSRLRLIETGTTMKHLNVGDMLHFSVPLPPSKAEQEAIAETLSDADALIESLERLLIKKRQLKQGAMQELLTGKKRVPGFSGDWEVKRIAEIASPSSEKNSAGERLTVLTCSKHLGFVDSLGYFKNQVFSRDTSGYKVIKRGQIGYPSNHVEEGSIGLQDLYDVALVSPIYVVFSVTEEADSYFLHRLLKLDSYRQEFATATSSSVDRRGSLRWPAFSEITVSLPPVEEQVAIAAILRDMDAEAAALEAKLTKARRIKEGMMQELLTGRIRLV
jgi:type I restriction enzyme S subunit